METFSSVHPPLQPFVKLIWQVHGFPEYTNQTIVPNGVIEVIFNFSDRNGLDLQLANKRMRFPRCFISGMNTQQIFMSIPSFHSFFGVQFHADAVHKLFAVPAGVLINDVVDMTLFDRDVDAIWHKVGETASFQQRVSVITEWLLGKSFELNERERAIVNFIDHSPSENFSALSLSEKMCYSSRQLSRKLIALTGLNTEEMLQYKKYLHALRAIHSSKLSLSEIAHQSHFFDQSHFIKVFRSYAGIPPGDYRKRMSSLPGHIFE